MPDSVHIDTLNIIHARAAGLDVHKMMMMYKFSFSAYSSPTSDTLPLPVTNRAVIDVRSFAKLGNLYHKFLNCCTSGIAMEYFASGSSIR